jgi:uncharacterized protein
MSEARSVQETILQDASRLALDDCLTFGCRKDLECFTKCCSDVSIVLTPYDVLRMKKALRLDSSEFLDRYTILSCTRLQNLPIVLLKMKPDDKRCPFVTDQGCSIYAHRPWACRMYPLGLAEPEAPNPDEHRFYFVIHEGQCRGHGQGSPCTVRDWVATQGIEAFEMMGASFERLMTHPFWGKGEPLTAEQAGMYVMACFDLDRFRRFVFETRFLELFDVDETRQEVLRTDDDELLDFAMEWLRYSLLKEKTMRLKHGPQAVARRAAGEADAAPGRAPIGSYERHP